MLHVIGERKKWQQSTRYRSKIQRINESLKCLCVGDKIIDEKETPVSIKKQERKREISIAGVLAAGTGVPVAISKSGASVRDD